MSGETMVCAAAIFNGAPLAIRPAFFNDSTLLGTAN